MRLIEDTPRLDIADVKALDSWPDIIEAGTVTIVVGTTSMKIALGSDQTLFGRRWYFACPSCSSHRRHVYLVAGRVVCRTCAGLKYWIQSLPGSSWRRDVAAPVLRRIGGLSKAPTVLGR
jgi:hypothetical protein